MMLSLLRKGSSENAHVSGRALLLDDSETEPEALKDDERLRLFFV